MGNNVIWYLLALGIGTVFLVALLASQPDVEIRIGELVADPDGQRRKERARRETAGHDRSARRSRRKQSQPPVFASVAI